MSVPPASPPTTSWKPPSDPSVNSLSVPSRVIVGATWPDPAVGPGSDSMSSGLAARLRSSTIHAPDEVSPQHDLRNSLAGNRQRRPGDPRRQYSWYQSSRLGGV